MTKQTPAENNVVTLLCQMDGQINQILRDDLKLFTSEAIGRPFAQLWQSEEQSRATRWLAQLQSSAMAETPVIELTEAGQTLTMHITGGRIQQHLLLVGVRLSEYTTDCFCQEMLGYVNHHLPPILPHPPIESRWYQAIWENAGDAMVLSDENGVVLTANQKYFELYNLSPEQVIGRSFEVIFPEIGRDLAKQLYKEVFYGEESSPAFENVVEQAGGALLTVQTHVSFLTDSNNQRVAMLSLIRDVTQRKQLQAEQQRDRQLLQKIIETTPNLVTILNLQTRELEYISPQVKQVTGYSAEEFQAANLELLVHPDDFPAIADQLRKLIDDTLQDEPEIDYRFFCKAGGERWLRSFTTIFERLPDGTPTKVLSTAQDITGRKLAEAQLKESLTEKEVLLKEVHHRVKNNLQIISSLLSLQSESLTEPGIRQKLQVSQNRVRSMALIHEKLYRTGNFSSLDFGEYMRNLANHLMNSYGRRDRPVKLHVEADSISLTLDTAIPCGLIVNELVSNALKHAFPSQTHTPAQQNQITITLQRFENDKLSKCSLAIHDNGVGLPPDFSWDNLTSLGLQLVPMLTEQIQGELEVDSANSGTAFTITFTP